MSDTESTTVARGAYAGLPILSEDNFADWDMQIVAYLTGSHDHVRVITPVRQSDGSFQDPSQPAAATAAASADEQKKAAEDISNWQKSERVVLGCLMATAGSLHREAVLKHRQSGTAVYKLYAKICNHHQQRDASQRHDAWMRFLALRLAPGESYMSLYRRVEAGYDRIDRITPADQTPEDRGRELILFTVLSALPHDDTLRTSLTTQKDVSLADAAAAMLRLDTSRKLANSEAEQANAAFSGSCWKCGDKDHVARDCPHREAIQQLVTKRKNASTGNGGNNYGKSRRERGKNDAKASASAADASANATNASTSTADRPNEVSGVASLLLSNESHVTDVWLCDSGASSSMSGDRSAFRSLVPDRRPIRLADGKVIYSKGLGSIHFSSDAGYVIIIENVLFVPRLSVNLFSANKFAKEHSRTHSETVEYPMRKWVNRQTGAVEFTATIRANDLAYLDWRVAPQAESANVSMEELHARLNHLPFPALRHLIRTRPIDGVPDRVTGTHPEDFCEDCVNGKLTRAPHTRTATRAEAPLQRVYTDVHGPVPTRSRRGHFYWVSFVDDHSRFPAVYFITEKSDVFTMFKRYRAWAENVTGRRIGILRDDKGGEYVSGDFDRYLADAGIRREHSIRDTPQQLGVAERLNRTLAEGITTILSQSGLTRTWWEDAAAHFLFGKIRLPSSVTNHSPYELFYGKRPSVDRLRPFGCLAYVHLQKDQHRALLPHAAQCIFISYPTDYKGWRFWDPRTRKEVISDSAVFRESVFPFRKPGLSAVDRSVDPSPPTNIPTDRPPADLSVPRPPDDLAEEPLTPEPADAAPLQAPHLVPRFQPLEIPPPPPAPPVDLPEQPRPSSEVRNLMTHFEHHPSGQQLPLKRASRARQPGALVEDAGCAESTEEVVVPIFAAMDYALATAGTAEPRTLAEAMARPDAAQWLEAAYAELQARVMNGTWELAQLPPGKRAIGSRWVFKLKRKPDGSVDKYKGRIVAQGYSQIAGVHYGEVFASTARMAAMRTVIALAAIEDLELETVDISTAFLNGEIDKEIFMKVPEGLEVDGEPAPGEDPKRWVLRLLKGLYGIKQGPRIWALKLHSVLTEIGFVRTDCDYSVYIYRRDNVKVVMPIHVDDLLIASNSRDAIQKVKSDLASRFKIHDQGPATSILGIKIERDRPNRSIHLSQPGYIESILDQFGMSDCNPVLTPMEENRKLSASMSPETPERQAEMKAYPYRELIGKLLYLAIATRPDIAYTVGVLCRFVENPGMDHWLAAKRVLRYLRGTVNMKLVYSQQPSPDLFTTFSDADLSGNPDNSRSTGGFAVCVGGGATQWGSRLQPHVSLSSTESEYTTASKVGCEIMWMRYLFEELGYDMTRPSPLLVDNKSAIQVLKHPEHQSTMKHVHRAYHWIREQVEQRLIAVHHVPGNENPADIFTKPLGRVKFTRFRDMLGLRV